YIVALSSYQIRHGTLTPKTGVWPSNDYNELIAFCQKSYLSTIKIMTDYQRPPKPQSNT
ncbi:hypothetical protein MNBD_GAMMA04-786, partial [hydrothermal vent metagenome]